MDNLNFEKMREEKKLKPQNSRAFGQTQRRQNFFGINPSKKYPQRLLKLFLDMCYNLFIVNKVDKGREI